MLGTLVTTGSGLAHRALGIRRPQGNWSADFDHLVNLFAGYFASSFSGGGALHVIHRGEIVVDAWTGFADAEQTRQWQRNTGAIGFSATKGVCATVIHRLVDQGLLDYDTPIAEYWPEFSQAGKELITVRHALSHRAGLFGLRTLARDADEVLDHLLMERRLAESRAVAPGRRPAYHTVTYGWLLAGIARAVTGKGMKQLVAEQVTQPLGLTGISLGQPEDRDEIEIAKLVPVVSSSITEPVFSAGVKFADLPLGPLRPVADSSLIPGLMNLFSDRQSDFLQTECGAANGVLTAHGLAELYNEIGGSCRGENEFLSVETARKASTVQTPAPDSVLGVPMIWRLGYHSNFVTRHGFGHVGLGGTVGWVDPVLDLSIGFVTNRTPALPSLLGRGEFISLGAAAALAAKRRQ